MLQRLSWRRAHNLHEHCKMLCVFGTKGVFVYDLFEIVHLSLPQVYHFQTYPPGHAPTKSQEWIQNIRSHTQQLLYKTSYAYEYEPFYGAQRDGLPAYDYRFEGVCI